MQFEHIKYVYFLGIGGIGMSALARWFNVNGFQVAGYDKTTTALTNTLQQEGIRIHFDDDVNAIPSEFLANPAQTLVVLTPAIPKDHQEWNFLIDNNFQILKRSQVLGLLASTMRTIAVAGTHGKTTTSSMVAHILKASGKNIAAFLGGITQNYQTNFLLNDPTNDLNSVLCVVEADEFDRSFLTLFPDIAVVTSTDADHLDIYGDHNHVLESFGAFVSQIKPNGRFFMKKGLALANHTGAIVQDFSFDGGDFHAARFRIENARFTFDLVYPGGVVPDVQLMMPGFHNVENALAAFASAWAVGVEPAQIKETLGTYRGVKRRFEYYLQTPTHVLIDDYAHHPTEVEAFLRSVRALYPDKHITAIFQPHLFTRTRDFQEGFAESLSLADRLLLLDIYPAREQPIEGISSKIVFDRVHLQDKILLAKSEVIQTLKNLPTEVVVTIGAGDVEQLLPDLVRLLNK
ncbi:MAG: UDP-N-acetylmuramate--L-alanine ligase [Spirosomataceae bacterium]